VTTEASRNAVGIENLHVARVAIPVSSGVAWGALAWSMSYSGSIWLFNLATWPALYIVAVAVIAKLSHSTKGATLIVVSAFLPFVLSYYTAMFIAFHTINWAYVIIWFIASVLVGPAAAALHVASNRRESVGMATSALMAALVMVDGTLRAVIDLGLGSPVAGQVFIDFVCAAVIVLVWNRSAKLRLGAAALFVPLAITVLVVGSAVHYGVDPFEHLGQWTRLFPW